MLFRKTKLDGVFIIDLEIREDERGFFARSWCSREFAEQGLNTLWLQDNISFNRKKGILRGLHYQVEPHGEIKLIRCTMGAIFDVVVDVRPGSKSLGEWLAVELSSENRRMIYIPKGFAHGYQTLTDQAEVFYRMSEYYDPESARGVRWDDPAFRIRWPEGDRIISGRDRALPGFKR